MGSSVVIYGRFGDPITIVGVAVIGDVKRLTGRRPDKVDREAIKHGSYVVVRRDNGTEDLYHQAFMRADGGISEIADAIEAADTSEVQP